MAIERGLWRGPITDRAQALRITKLAAWGFGGVAVLLLIPMLVDMARADRPTIMGDLAVILLLAIPSALLLTHQSRGAAAILFAASLALLAGSLAFVGFGVARDGSLALLGLPLSFAWILLCLLGWRAVKAAFALHQGEIEDAAGG
jgi:hypothetical protein